MKSKFIMGLVLIMLFVQVLSFSAISFAAGKQVQVKLAKFPVTINGVVINNENAKYPLIVYKDITYFPMTWNYTQALGLETNWNDQKGLVISQLGGYTQQKVQQELSNRNNSLTFQAVLPNYPITVNGKAIQNTKEPYPILNFRNITYFPLTWRFAHDEFQWDIQWDAKKGLSIVTQQRPVFKEIIYDDQENLYIVSMMGDVYKLNKSLQSDIVKLTEQEVEMYRTKKYENDNLYKIPSKTKENLVTRNGDSLYYSDQELISLSPYIEKDNKYYKEHPDITKVQGVSFDGNTYTINSDLELLSLSVYYILDIPAPYTPHEDFLFVIYKGKVHQVEGFNQLPEYVVFNQDGSYWVYSHTPDEYTTRNFDRRGQLVHIDSTGKATLLNERIQTENLMVLEVLADGTLLVQADNMIMDNQNSTKQEGIYRIMPNLQVDKLFTFHNGKAYVDREGAVFLVDHEQVNTIRNLTKEVSKHWWDYELK